MDSLRNILKSQSSLRPIFKKAEASLIVDAANSALQRLFGPPVKKFARAIYIKGGTLTIACLSSIISQEIRLNEQSLIGAINAKTAQKSVLKITYLA